MFTSPYTHTLPHSLETGNMLPVWSTLDTFSELFWHPFLPLLIPKAVLECSWEEKSPLQFAEEAEGKAPLS